MPDSHYVDIKCSVEPLALNYVLHAVRFICLLCLYGGLAAVMWSVLVIRAPQGQLTPGVSPTMQCVMNLTMQFFFVYLSLFLVNTISDLVRPLPYMMHILSSAEATVKFCPMLAILFVGTRMRA